MTVTWLYCLLQCFIDIGAIFDRGFKVSDETIVLHKHLHLLRCNLSVTLWTIVLCVWVEGGGESEREEERRRKKEVGGMTEEEVNMYIISCYLVDNVTSHMTSHDTPTSWVAVCHMTSMTHPPCWLAVCMGCAGRWEGTLLYPLTSSKP